MTNTSREALFEGTGCDVRFDALTRQLYATDASIYQLEPEGVAFPRSAEEAAAVIRRAADAGIPIIPRGAGTGLAGGAIGTGLVIDFARYNRGILAFDQERRIVRVEAGVVLDQLNEFLRPHGFWFGPDVATSSRATLGGMISNNSSGARAPIYGTTADHTHSLEIILPDGTVATIGAEADGLPELAASVRGIVEPQAGIVEERFPNVLAKRWPGFGLDRYLRTNHDLTRIVASSEGTLAAIFSAELNVVPLPTRKGLGLVFFNSVMEAMRATVDVLDLEPVAIEHIDRVLFEQTRGKLAFQAARDFLELDAKPCEAILLIEFYGEVEDKLRTLADRNLGLRTSTATAPDEMDLIWGMRKAGLSIVTGRKGPAKPVAGIEDASVRPEQLPDYVEGLQKAMTRAGLEASFYGHAASGLLHVRPIVDLHKAEDIAKFRQISDEVSELVREFKGSIAAEHGIGMARAEYFDDHVGPELLDTMRRVKAEFDPKNVMNPGKLFPGTYTIDTNLRQGAGHTIELPFTPILKFAEKDESFVGNLEQCNGCGGCRKDPPTMCPTYLATGEEIMSTRGRANTIRAVLERRLGDGGLLRSDELEEALSNCLACKACTTECPSNVNMTLLKSELVHARHQEDGVDLRARMVSNVDLLGRLGCLMPALANASLKARWVRVLMDKVIGFHPDRPLPPYARQRFDHWFAKRRNGHTGTRGRVFLWDDTFVRYNDPHIGKAAVKVLEAAGYEVVLPEGRKCCGRPAFSVGRLDMARRLGEHNVALFLAQESDAPLLFLEPSCFSMFKQDYTELGIDGAENVAERCLLFEHFVFELLERDPEALRFKPLDGAVAVHGHCHTKALTDASVTARLAALLPGAQADMLETGCCGMAGAFGALRSKYDLSLEVAKPLVDKVNALEPGTELVACGTSCRHQIGHLTKAQPRHIAELMAEAIE
jgi:FAD/FMN-containing dehydrogenase/Fe-S oxidoreductase